MPFLLVRRSPQRAQINALRWPSNGEAPSAENGNVATDAFVCMYYPNPHLDGLPFNGPDGEGWTIIFEVLYRAQAGYHDAFWLANTGPNNLSTFLWKGVGEAACYAGIHPYPQPDPISGLRADGTVHDFELAGLDMDGDGDGDPSHNGDNLQTLAGGRYQVVKDRWFLQAMVLVDNGDDTCTGTFYTDLPSVANNRIIRATSAPGFFDEHPSGFALSWGDSWWARALERMGGTLRRHKVINKALSQAEVLSESAVMNDLVTPVAQSRIWLGKTGYTSNTDLGCNYGTGRGYTWFDPATKAVLVPT